jgi:hypothetical protein
MGVDQTMTTWVNMGQLTESVIPQVEQVAYLIYSHLGSRSSRLGSFRHDGGVVVRDLPLTVLIYIHICVSGLDLVTSGAHGEFVDTGVASPSVSDGNMSIKDDSLRLELQEVIKV